MPRLRRAGTMVLGFCASLATALSAAGANISLQGSLTADDQVQFFNLLLSAPASIDIRSYGYGGGTLSSGATVPRGGFDTVLTIFNSSGVFLSENDDGVGVATDPSTGEALDARLTQMLAAGNYIVSLSQYDNFATGANLVDGFDRLGEGNFTADPAFSSAAPCASGRFRDFSGTAGQCRNGTWAIDFLNVTQVAPAGVLPIPEPSPAMLLGPALGLLLAWRRVRR